VTFLVIDKQPFAYFSFLYWPPKSSNAVPFRAGVEFLDRTGSGKTTKKLADF
jgi:hypothetical protein